MFFVEIQRVEAYGRQHTVPQGSQMQLCESLHFSPFFFFFFFNHECNGKRDNLKVYRDHVKNQAKRVECELLIIGVIGVYDPVVSP